jgi:hypothetical protein
MKTLLGTALAIGVLAAGAGPALAQPAAPIDVTTCAAGPTYRPYNEGPLQAVQCGGDVAIGFVNRASTAATSVRFAIGSGGAVRTVDERGSFASGTRIDRVASLATPSAAGGASCEVEAVSFADGTTWQR